MNVLLDTNILVDYLAGKSEAKKELALYREPSISLITWMEVLVGAKTEQEVSHLKNFLNSFQVIQITQPIAEKAVELRRERRIRLPDAVIWASAQVHNLLLVTRNTRDFSPDNPGVRVPW